MTTYFAQLLVAATAVASSNALNIEDSTKTHQSHYAMTSVGSTDIDQTSRNLPTKLSQACTGDACNIQAVCTSPAYWCAIADVCDPTNNSGASIRSDPYYGMNFISVAYGIIKLS